MKKAEKNMLNLWATIFLANALLIYVASLLYPAYIVLGNDSLSPWAATVVTSLILTLILAIAYPLVKSMKLKKDKDLISTIFYIAINIVGVWLLARGAIYTGFGITSYLVALVLGAILVLSQYIIWKVSLERKKK